MKVSAFNLRVLSGCIELNVSAGDGSDYELRVSTKSALRRALTRIHQNIDWDTVRSSSSQNDAVDHLFNNSKSEHVNPLFDTAE